MAWRLDETLEALGVSGRELARRLGHDDDRVVRRWRKTAPTWENAIAVAEALGASLDDLAGRATPAASADDPPQTAAEKLRRQREAAEAAEEERRRLREARERGDVAQGTQPHADEA